MMSYYERRYIDDICLKRIKKDYYNDPRYRHIPRDEKERVLAFIRYRVSFEIFSSSSGIDSDYQIARQMRFLGNIASKEQLGTWEDIIRKWLWCCLKKDLSGIISEFLDDKVFIPQGDDQKLLQDEYLDLISDVTHRLIQQVVDNFDAIDTSYLSDTELAEIVERYGRDDVYPTITMEDKQRICKRLRHRVAMTLHEHSADTEKQKKIAQWLMTLDSEKAAPTGMKTPAGADIRWLWYCIKQEYSEIARVFHYENIIIPTDAVPTEQQREYLAMIADATKMIIARSALSFDEVSPVVVTSTDHHPPRSILKRTAVGSQTGQSVETNEKGLSRLVTWGISTSTNEARHQDKKPKVDEENADSATRGCAQ